jgi:hypothetical protein
MPDPRYRLVSPFDTGLTDDPSQEPVVASQYSLISPFEAMGTPTPSLPSLPSLPSGMGSDAMNWAAILGGLGLGLARPRVGPQALQNLQAVNMMQWRDDQRALAQQRLELQQREEATKRAILGQIMAPEGGPPSFTAQAAPPPAKPEVSNVPHFAAPPPTSLQAPTQFTPQSRMAEAPPQPFFTGPPSPIRGNTSTGLSAYGLSKTQSTNRGSEKEQATNAAVNDLTTAWMQQPDQAQQNPRRLLKEVLARNPLADSKEVRQNLSNTLFETYHASVLTTQPNLDPKSAFREAYKAAAQDLGPGMFVPTDQMRTLATQVPSLEEQRSLSAIQGDKTKQGQLNQIEGAREAALTGARNTANFYTQPYTPTEAAAFERPPVVGTTPAQQAGVAPMSKERTTGLESRERERSQTQTAVETVAPTIANIVRKAEEVRKSFGGMDVQSLLQKGKNWVDVMQSQVTGFPATEMGKLIQSYDTLVQTNGPLMARVVQAQRGNLTEQERIIGQQGFPATFRELYNNPIAGNDRLSVLGDVMALELRDPTFRLGRLDAPMSEFEKGVEAYRQRRIATRPELYTNAPLLPPTGAPPGAAPPTLSAPPLTPEDQAVKDRINQEIQDYLKRRGQ